ncbi:unnamed protein product [Schistosoma margrebowiei]|uniref:Uncharacterized protein n=1 Tax=Schistosoma margrebowiei TaxID=48269 RepID=A0A183N4M1_9TREM|nr:unnamed protein product [Schistosoma margrebowiei]
MSRQFYCMGAETWRTTKAIIQEIQVFTQSTSDPLARHHQQRPTMEENKPDPSGRGNQEVDRTHIEESTQLRHKTSPHMESLKAKGKEEDQRSHYVEKWRQI